MEKSTLHIATFLAAGLVLPLLTGCSGTPTRGEQAQNISAEAREIADSWAEGEEMVVKGEKLVAKGKEQVEDGETLIRKGKVKIREGQENTDRGNRLVQQGRRKIAAAESVFSEKYPEQYGEILRHR